MEFNHRKEESFEFFLFLFLVTNLNDFVGTVLYGLCIIFLAPWLISQLNYVNLAAFDAISKNLVLNSFPCIAHEYDEDIECNAEMTKLNGDR